MPLRKKNQRFVILTALSDVVMIGVGYLLAYSFRFYASVIPLKDGTPEFQAYGKALFVVVPTYLIFFRGYGLYEADRHIRRIEEIFTVFKATTFAVLVLTAMTFFYRGFSYSRVHLLIAWFFSLCLVSGSRYFLIQWEYRRKKQKKQITRVLVIGATRHARNIIQWARNNPHYGQEIIGVLARDTALVGKHVEGVPVLGKTDQCENFIREVRPDQVVLADPGFPREKITDLVVACEDQWIEFKVVADFYGLLTRCVEVEYVSQIPLLGFRSLPLDDLWNRTLKRTLDVVVSSCLLVATFPVWLFAVLAIKVNDGGPVFYRQERVGRDQRPFPLLKFRTMAVDAEAQSGPVWSTANDTRRTAVGNFLRRWNIDELPQLLNVLKGAMSLVGPRPERPHFVGKFRESIPRYMARHKIKSGMTGWAQVNGYRGNTSIQERLKYDLYYMENWSLLLDVEILFMTFSRKALKNAY